MMRYYLYIALLILVTSCDRTHACFCRVYHVTASDTLLVHRDNEHYKYRSTKKANRYCEGYTRELELKYKSDSANAKVDCVLERYR